MECTRVVDRRLPPVRWLILLHQLAAGRDYLRVKTWRRLQAIGAVQLRGAVYVLPAGDAARAALEDVARTILDGGGEALLAEACFDSGLEDGQVIAAFRAARARDYDALVAALPVVPPGARPTSVRRAEIAAALGRARRRLAAIRALDFFEAPGREAAAAAIAALEHRLIPAAPRSTRVPGTADLRGRVWVTRRGVHVDRMACAWLIRRFIDPLARFRFVPGLGHRPGKNELRFDMAEAEFTHEGDRCSFEVLLERARLTDPALTGVGEVVHDLDLGDDKFHRPECAGVARAIAAIVAAQEDDLARLSSACAVLDELHQSFHRPAPP